MFGIIDCNNFYASCERVFNPKLKDKPVIVLSNNDGCVIARSQEVKDLGIKMGVPFYQIREIIEQNDIQVFSSNYALYGDMSNRFQMILNSLVPEVEIYSIDEAFINFSGFNDLKSFGERIVKKIIKDTGIPVCLGIAPTKTLSKIANKFAKKYPGYNKVCLIDTEDKRIKALQLTSIEDVWGIGRQHTKRLNSLNVNTAYDFTMLPLSWVRKHMSVTGERTWKELQGSPCIDIELHVAKKKQICTSRSFNVLQSEFDQISESVTCYAGMCAEKLRKQKSYAVSLLVFIQTNSFRNDLLQYYNCYTIKLPVPTDNTTEIVHYARLALRTIFRKGYQYKKAGVIITEITDHVQTNVFDTVDREKYGRLMKVVDNLNSGYSRNNLILAAQGTKGRSKLKRELLSPCYSTKLEDSIIINCI